MPAPQTAFKIYGDANVNRLTAGGGNIYLLPPPIAFCQPNTLEARLAEMSGWLWEDGTRRKEHEYLLPWCSMSADGLKITLKQKTMQFDLNNQAPIVRKTGILEEASLSFTGLDIGLSTAHYLDMIGDKKALFYQEKPQDTEGSESGTEWILNGPSTLDRPVFVVYVMLGHPEHFGRKTVLYHYGTVVNDVDAEASINNPLGTAITFNLMPFPNIKQANSLPVYQVVETPVTSPTVEPAQPTPSTP